MGEPIASRIWGLPKMVPSNGWFIMENTIAGWFMDGLFHGKSENQMDDLEVARFQETCI